MRPAPRRPSYALALLATAGCFVPREQDRLVSDERCTACHGSPSNPGDPVERGAPPFDTAGHQEVSSPGVGAHQVHLTPSATHHAVACGECHVVPQRAQDVGHDDDPGPAEVTFGRLATADGGLASRYDATAGTCASTSCHGPERTSGVWTSPRSPEDACGSCHGVPPPHPHPASQSCWVCHDTLRPGTRDFLDAGTHVDGVLQVRAGPLDCAACHGAPPPAPHPQVVVCAGCHANVAPDGGFIDPGRHVDGVLDAVLPTGCVACHGSATNPAPPRDTRGTTSTSAPGVGAHQAHLSPSTARAVPCGECHRVPAQVLAPGHLDGVAEVAFTGVAASFGGAGLSYDRATNTCRVACHDLSAVLGRSVGALHPRPVWTQVGAGQAQCGGCHGLPPPPPHPRAPDGLASCADCHPDMTGFRFSWPDLHVDGKVTFVLPP